MAKRKLKQPPNRHPPHAPGNFRGCPATLTVHNPHAAGIDVHSDKHVVCVGPGLVQDFGAYPGLFMPGGEMAFWRALNTCSSDSSAVQDARNHGGSVRGDRRRPVGHHHPGHRPSAGVVPGRWGLACW